MALDLSTLERTISNLEHSLTSLERWLFIMTALVVVGLILEYWHEIPESIRDLRKSRKWISKPVFIILGAILITVGVAGELVVQAIESRKETTLRNANDAIVSKLRVETAKANERAANAIERAAQLTAALAPRSLSDKDQNEIADECQRFAKPGVLVRVVVDSGNGRTLGIQIWNALKSAKLNSEFIPKNEVWYETSISGPIAPPDSLAAWTGITKAMATRMPIFGGRQLPPGSPITIAVGERLIGKLP